MLVCWISPIICRQTRFLSHTQYLLIFICLEWTKHESLRAIRWQIKHAVSSDFTLGPRKFWLLYWAKQIQTNRDLCTVVWEDYLKNSDSPKSKTPVEAVGQKDDWVGLGFEPNPKVWPFGEEGHILTMWIRLSLNQWILRPTTGIREIIIIGEKCLTRSEVFHICLKFWSPFNFCTGVDENQGVQ